MTGTRLKALPARLESWENYKKHFPNGEVLSPTGRFATMETYSCNPYGVYESHAGPYPHFPNRRYAARGPSYAAGRLAQGQDRSLVNGVVAQEETDHGGRWRYAALNAGSELRPRYP